MGLFSDLEVTEEVQGEEDIILGAGKRTLDSGVYDFTIAMAYADESKGGAKNVNFHFKDKDGNEMKVTEYITSGKAKGCLPYYLDKNGNKRFLPGYNTVNAISLLSIGKELFNLESEEKVISVYDFDQRKEVPTKKQVFMDLLGKDITLGVIEVITDKNVKDSSGNYVPSGNTYMGNEISKVFRTKDKLTVTEIKAKATEPAFYNTWKESNEGKVVDKSAAKKGHIPANSSPPTQTETETTTQTESLFG